MITKYTFNDPVIESIYMRYPEFIRKKCLILRDLIFNVGSSDSRIGPINETLRWGAPSYIPLKTKSGSMIRIHHYPNKCFDFALYFLCNTTLVDTFRQKYPNIFQFGGNRSLEFYIDKPLPLKEIEHCIYLSFTYNLNK